ncbi:hypothetical protein [Methylobacterium oryzisoli]|uniref:hypothetical protein n=1 Tax=Methylobacterium oryzisoli TaxID=3385502 RepID=UPI0038916B53
MRPNWLTFGFVDINQPTFTDYFMEKGEQDLAWMVACQMIAEGIIKGIPQDDGWTHEVLTKKGLGIARVDPEMYECWVDTAYYGQW